MSLEGAGLQSDTAAGDIVSLLVNADPPYGVTFEADNEGNAAVIKSFEKMPDGKFGPLQKHGGLHIGDVLFAINDIHLDAVSHTDAIAMVRDRNIFRKTFKFMNSRDYYRKRRGITSNPTLAAESSKSSFLSSIRKYRISTDSSNRKYVEYEIACQFRIPGARVQKDIVHKWSVYKRYSEFERLNSALRVSLGWLFEGIEFPSPYTFAMNKLSPDFIEQRRDELNAYWQKIIAIEKVCDFTKHHCSGDLKAFLTVEEVMKNAKASTPEPLTDSVEEDQPGELDRRPTANRKAITRASSLRRRSMNPTSVDESTPPRHDGTEKPDVASETTNAVKPSAPPPPRPPPPMRRESSTNMTSSTTPPVNNLARQNLLSQINNLNKA